MAEHEPAGVTGAIPFPDPFGPYPDAPYPGTDRLRGVRHDPDPATDPALPTFDAAAFDPFAVDGFDPFAPDAFWFPERPWYRKRSAMVALGAVGVAVIALLVAAVLLVSRESGGSGPPPGDGGSSTAPAPAPAPTTPLSSGRLPESAPPPPPPPAPSEPPDEPPAQTGGEWVPPYPRGNPDSRTNVTTPQTRPPDISVRPTHRPAFPNQPGSG